MSRDPDLRLADIIEACNRIADYIQGFDGEAFVLDMKTQDAVIRQFAPISRMEKL